MVSLPFNRLLLSKSIIRFSVCLGDVMSYFDRFYRKLLSLWPRCQRVLNSSSKNNPASSLLHSWWTDMNLPVVLFCLLNVVMSGNKLTSVVFEIFGNVQGMSRTCGITQCLIMNERVNITRLVFLGLIICFLCVFRCLLQDGELHVFSVPILPVLTYWFL